jgi:hypothetical protein
MKSTLNRWATSIVLLSFFAIIGIAGTRSVARVASDVFVTNTTAAPVPVAVQGSPAVQATVVGTPNVKVTNTVAVPVRDAAHGKDGYQMFKLNTTTSGNTADFMTASALPGERFVITNIAATSSGTTPGTADVEATVSVVSSSSNLGEVIVPMATVPTMPALTTGNQPTLLYLDPGQTLNIQLLRTTANDSNSTVDTVTVTGYRVTYP